MDNHENSIAMAHYTGHWTSTWLQCTRFGMYTRSVNLIILQPSVVDPSICTLNRSVGLDSSGLCPDTWDFDTPFQYFPFLCPVCVPEEAGYPVSKRSNSWLLCVQVKPVWYLLV